MKRKDDEPQRRASKKAKPSLDTVGKKAALVTKLTNIQYAADNDLIDEIETAIMPIEQIIRCLNSDDDPDFVNWAYDLVNEISPINPVTERNTIVNNLLRAGARYAKFNIEGALPDEIYEELARLTAEYSYYEGTQTVFFTKGKLTSNSKSAAPTTVSECDPVTMRFVELREAIIEYAEQYRDDPLIFTILGVLLHTLNNLGTDTCNQQNAMIFAAKLRSFAPSHKSHKSEMFSEDDIEFDDEEDEDDMDVDVVGDEEIVEVAPVPLFALLPGTPHEAETNGDAVLPEGEVAVEKGFADIVPMFALLPGAPHEAETNDNTVLPEGEVNEAAINELTDLPELSGLPTAASLLAAMMLAGIVSFEGMHKIV